MAAGPDTLARLFVFGVSHRSAEPALRERLLTDIEEHAGLLDEIGAIGLEEALVLGTCDRLEIIGLDPDPRSVAERIIPAFAARGGLPDPEVRSQSYLHEGEAALRHLFAVASSLDSQVVGEPQVLGQVKQCHRLAAEARLIGPQLEGVLQAAYGTAKRVRGETSIAERPVSIAAAALLVARNLHGDLARCQGLLVGLGEMGDLLTMELKQAGLERLTILHPLERRADAAARRLGCHFRPYEELEDALSQADIVVAAAGTGRHSITADLMALALKKRRNKPILAIDAAVPGDIEPAVENLDDAFVYSLDELESVAREGQARREAVATEAWSIVDEALADFLERSSERAAVPAVVALRGHFEAVRDEVLSDGGKDSEAVTRRLIGRLLHDPSEALRQIAAKDPARAAMLEEAIAQLFHLKTIPATQRSDEEDET